MRSLQCISYTSTNTWYIYSSFPKFTQHRAKNIWKCKTWSYKHVASNNITGLERPQMFFEILNGAGKNTVISRTRMVAPASTKPKLYNRLHVYARGFQCSKLAVTVRHVYTVGGFVRVYVLSIIFQVITFNYLFTWYIAVRGVLCVKCVARSILWSTNFR